MPASASDADQHVQVRARQRVAQPAHLADVLLAGERVDHDAGGEEEQRLEEGVRHQVEHRVAVRADAGREEHVADLRHRRVRDHALDVGLHERDQAGDEQRDRADRRGEVLDELGAPRRSGAARTSRYTPAVTIVAAWMSALTGVGPSIASGSHVWSGSCADFATAPPSRPSAASVTTVSREPVDALEDACEVDDARSARRAGRSRAPSSRRRPRSSRTPSSPRRSRTAARGGSRSAGTTRGRRGPSRRAGGRGSLPRRAAASRRRRAPCTRRSGAPRPRRPCSRSSTRRSASRRR